MTSLPVDQLPRILCDAMQVCRALGLRYLWIDALCIIQNSKRDWEVESANMRYVYWNCQLCISATCAGKPEDGLLVQKHSELLRPLIYERDGVIWKLQDEDTFATELSRSPLSKRAWALQERMLPPRTLMFGKYELFWECQETRAAEKGRTDSASRELPKLRACQSEYEPADVWPWVLQNYGTRSLTYPQKDKLVALGAVAEHIASIYNDEYFAGMFRSNLLADLIWSTGCPEPLQRPELYMAPSWSWASVDGELQTMQSRYLTDNEYFSRILDIKVELVDGAKQFGQVHGGFLTMRGLLASFDLFKVGAFEDDDVHLLYDTLRDKEAGHKYLRYLLILRTQYHFDALTRVALQGLAIEKVEDQGPNVYRRVGQRGRI